MADGPGDYPPEYKYIGLVRAEAYECMLTQALAIGSGLFIGSSFVFKKKGLLQAQRKYATTAGESHAYLKNFMWWTGMTIMILGEVLNFVAYMFADAVLVTPMGALSVVVCAILSSIFLKERLTLFGKVGCFLCIVGSVIIAVNAPEQKIGGDIRHYEHMFIAPGFLTWLGICIVVSCVLAFVVAPKYGKKNMLVYIVVCSLIGGLSVSVTSGLGSAIILSIRGKNQFTYWFTYFLLGFIIVTLLVEINYLNKALELFNTAAVTPTYYVLFTAATIITSVILSQGMHATAIANFTMVFGFFTICSGIVLLQLSKMDPQELEQQPGLDRKSSMLLHITQMHHDSEPEDSVTHIEDPGVDTIRGGMGIVGSLMRAKSTRRVASQRRQGNNDDDASMVPLTSHPIQDSSMPRYQLYDRPVSFTPPPDHEPAIRFAPGADEPHGHHAKDADELSDVGEDHGPSVLASFLEHGLFSRSSHRSARKPSQKMLEHEYKTSSPSLVEEDVDVAEQTAKSSLPVYEDIDLPPIWTDDPMLDEAHITSPTSILDDYAQITPQSPVVRNVSRGDKRRLFSLRKFSRGGHIDDGRPQPKVPNMRSMSDPPYSRANRSHQ